MSAPSPARRIGFVSTRFAGTDGVSLEAAKWAGVLEELGHQVLYFAGQCDRPPERTRLVPGGLLPPPRHRRDQPGRLRDRLGGRAEQARGADREIRTTSRADFFSIYIRPPRDQPPVHELRASGSQDELYDFARDFDLDLLVVENALAIPLNLPLGLALAEFIAETGFPIIAHHHDFHWERQRFLVNCVPDYIAAAFPPTHPSIRHVVINSVQADQLACRHGLDSRVIPNVMDFEREPRPPTATTRPRSAPTSASLAGELLFLQPTRVIQRKGIEHAIELTRRIGRPARLVISHAAGDEGIEYVAARPRVRRAARRRRPLRGGARRRASAGPPPTAGSVYALADVYPAADLVTYPSSIEGFGNAFLEAIYYRRPIVVNNYSTYEVDIKPQGLPRHLVRRLHQRRHPPSRRAGSSTDPTRPPPGPTGTTRSAPRYFSFAVLRRHLSSTCSSTASASGSELRAQAAGPPCASPSSTTRRRRSSGASRRSSASRLGSWPRRATTSGSWPGAAVRPIGGHRVRPRPARRHQASGRPGAPAGGARRGPRPGRVRDPPRPASTRPSATPCDGLDVAHRPQRLLAASEPGPHRGPASPPRLAGLPRLVAWNHDLAWSRRALPCRPAPGRALGPAPDGVAGRRPGGHLRGSKATVAGLLGSRPGERHG